jgi:hypothetical protein
MAMAYEVNDHFNAEVQRRKGAEIGWSFSLFPCPSASLRLCVYFLLRSSVFVAKPDRATQRRRAGTGLDDFE